LLDRRLVIVTGKGGTGKTTVSAALALAASQRGLRVLVAEFARGSPLARLLDPNAPETGPEGFQLTRNIRVMRIDPFAALAEYIGLQVGFRRVAERVLNNRSFRQLMDAAPGWRELITLGKIWHLEQLQREGRPLYDLIIVDAPATGHGLTMLDVPRVVASAVRSGPLRQQSQRVEALITDPSRTLLLPVARAEELPARETVQLVDRVRNSLQIRVDRVVVNAMPTRPFPESLGRLDETLARLPADLNLGALPSAPTLAACAHYLRKRYELCEHYATQIARTTGLPIVRLPNLSGSFEEGHEIAALAAGLLEPPRADR
jgi:anion-transporting  ArsA/GET3 family ATPase